MSGGLEFWQKEAQRYDSASRSLMSRVRTEISLGLSALVAIVAAAVVNEFYFALMAVPLLALAIWSLVLWSVQEAFLLDAHLMYAESMMGRELQSTRGERFPTWEAHGGKVGRFGWTLRIMVGSWGLVTFAVMVVSAVFAAPGIGIDWEPWNWASTITSLSLIASAAWSTDRAGAGLFKTMKEELALNHPVAPAPARRRAWFFRRRIPRGE